jgi:hypothetical protein
VAGRTGWRGKTEPVRCGLEDKIQAPDVSLTSELMSTAPRFGMYGCNLLLPFEPTHPTTLETPTQGVNFWNILTIFPNPRCDLVPFYLSAPPMRLSLRAKLRDSTVDVAAMPVAAIVHESVCSGI